jgi:hypothetical protein
MIRKGIVLIVMLLFIGMMINPASGNILSFDDITPPITTCTLEPPVPNGDNGWYISNVTVTLNATDDSSGVKAIYYRISGGEWKNQSGDIVIFILDHDCLKYGIIEFYAIDYAGNQEEIKSVDGIHIDQLPPEVNVTWTAYREGLWWYLDFIIIAEDNCSGCDCRIEFFINNELQEVIEGIGPDYVFTIQWSEEFRKFTFFFYCYDFAGNVAIVFINGSNITSHPFYQNYFLQFSNWLNRFPLLLKILTILGCIYFW